MGTTTPGRPSLKDEEKSNPSNMNIILDVEDEDDKYFFILHPDTRYRIGWDIFVSIFIVYSVIIVPLRIGFDIVVQGPRPNFDDFVDIVFFMDIVITSITAYYKDDILITKWKSIFWRYFFSWFLIDLLSTLPIDDIAKMFLTDDGSGSNLTSLKLLRLIRLVKLVRLLKLAKFSKSLDSASSINPALLRIIKLMFQIIFTAHILCCFWFLVSTLDENTNLTWVVEHGLLGEDLSTQYLGSFYWTISTMMSVGYGDVYAVNDSERLYSIFVQILGAMLFGFMIANITAFLETFDPQASAYRAKMDGLKEYLRERDLPAPLVKRVKKYYEYILSKQSIFDDVNILSNLPHKMMEGIMMHIHGKTANTIKFLKTEEVAFVTYIMARTHPLMASAGETIAEEGNIGMYLFIVTNGEIHGSRQEEDNEPKLSRHESQSISGGSSSRRGSLLSRPDSYRIGNNAFDWVTTKASPNQVLVAKYKEGSHFGDIAILRNKPSDLTYRAERITHMLHVSKADLEYALYLCPSSAWRFRGQVEKHHNLIQECLASTTNFGSGSKEKVCIDGESIERKEDNDEDIPRPTGNFVRARRKSITDGTPLSPGNRKIHPRNDKETVTTSKTRSLKLALVSDESDLQTSSLTKLPPATPKIGEVINSIKNLDRSRSRLNMFFHQTFEDVELTTSQILRSWIIPPAYPLKVKWDLYIAALIVYSTITVPLQISFQLESTGGALYFSYLTFRTAYESDEGDVLVIIPSSIAWNYFKGWLAIDFFSTFPFDLIMEAIIPETDGGGGPGSEFVSSLKIIKIFRLVRLLKLIRLLKLKSLLGNLDDYIEISPAFMKLGSLVLQISFISHLFGCFWFFCTSQADDPRGMWWFKEGHSPNPSEDFISKYIGSLYWAFSTMTTVGYGDIAPTTNEERIYAIIIMILGASVFGYVVGSIASLIAMFDLSEVLYKQKMGELDEYLKEQDVPKDLRKLCKKSYGYFLSRSSVFDEKAILKELSPSLRNEILMHVHQDAIKVLPIFQGQSISFTCDVLQMLHPELSLPKTKIIRYKDLGSQMFFIVSGNVAIEDYNVSGESKRYVLHAGNMFGHDALLKNDRNQQSVTSIDIVHMYVLSKAHFGELVDSFPNLALILQGIIWSAAKKQDESLGINRKTDDGNIKHKWKIAKSKYKQMMTLSPSRCRNNLHDMGGMLDRVGSSLSSRTTQSNTRPQETTKIEIVRNRSMKRSLSEQDMFSLATVSSDSASSNKNS